MIEFQNIRKVFSGVVALDSISFRIEDGTACGYIGPNGAGKTTTARIIVGLETPDSGSVNILGELIGKSKSEAQKRIGYVPESPRLYESLTPAETIAVASLLKKKDKKTALNRLNILSEIFSFSDSLHKPLHSLSKGTKQKIVISLALLFEPAILILDEPTDGLDVRSITALKLIMKTFTSRGGTIFYCSHLLDIVEGVCDKVYIINEGRITADFVKSDFMNKRGYLETAFLENIGSRNEETLISAFFDSAG